MSAPESLSVEQRAALLALHSRPRRTAQVSVVLNRDRSAVLRLLEGLYTRRLVDRHFHQPKGGDGAAVMIRKGGKGSRWWVWALTPAGRQMLKGAPAVAR